MFSILIYITETASLLYLLDSKILCLLVFWHLLCLKKNKMYSVHGSHSFISFLSCSCTNVLSALAYTHPQLDIKVVNTHFLITQLQATVGPKGPSSRPTSHPHYTPNHLHLITQRCDIYLPCILEFLQVLALNLTSFSWTLVLFWQQENGRKLNKPLHHPRFNHVLQIANSGRETFLVLCFEFWDKILYFQDFQWFPTSLFQYQAPSV